MPRSRPGRLRLANYFLSSLALHAAVVGLVSLKSCGGDPSLVVPERRASLVTVEVTTFSPPVQPKTPRPGGGAPAPRIDDSPAVSNPIVRRAPERKPERVSSRSAVLPEEPRGKEAAVATTVDVIAAPSAAHGAAPPAVVGPPGTGPGSRGGPGGPGAGQGGGGIPIVSGKFPFGSDARAAFKGVACFISPGILRIADVRECAPAAVFYTNTFDVSERQQGQGFPGISGRSTWFMIEYTGVFTVHQDGKYEFRLHSDDGSYLLIDGTQVIENDGKHKPESRWGNIELQTGEHQLKVLYAQTTDRMALQLYVRVPGSRLEKLFTPRI
jgi:PA14 domain